MRILFIIPTNKYSGAGYSYSPPFPHLGVAYLTAILQKEGIIVKIVDMRCSYSLKTLSNFIAEFDPQIIGITSFSYGYRRAYEIIEHCKLVHKDKTVIIGGPHVSAIGEKVLNDSKADFAIEGEGEITFMEFCKAVENGEKNYSKIDGLIWRDGDQVKVNKKRPFIIDLDLIPFPEYEKFELERYISYGQRLLPIITSRGCPYECVYCSVKLSMGRGFRARSPENVVEEMEYWYKKGWKVFDINDDCFSVDIKRAIKICELIKEKGLKIEYKLYNGIRADRITLELARAMKESGCTFVAFGCESGNQEVLKNIKKSIKLEKIREAVDICNKVGLPNQVNFIIGHPGEDYEKAMDSIRFASSLPTNFVVFYNCVPYPGTELFEWIKQKGTFCYPPEVYLNEICYGEVDPIYETQEFPANDRRKVLRKGILLNRKTLLIFKLGKLLGSIAYLFAMSDTLWTLGATFFKGTKIGDRIFVFFTASLQKT